MPRNGSVLHWSAENPMNAVGKMVEDILTVAPLNAMDIDEAGRLPLHCAAMSDQAIAGANIERLLEAYPQGASVADNFSKLPLHYAVESKIDWAEEVVQQLLEQFPLGTKHVDLMGEIALMGACRNTAPFAERIVRLLLEADDSSPHFKDAVGRHPHHIAVRNLGSTSVEIVKQLMAGNAKGANATDSLGRTPLHCAGQALNTAAIEVMIDMGADCNVLDQDGLTVLSRAAKEGQFDIVRSVLKVDPEAEGKLKEHRTDEFGTKDIDFPSLDDGATALHHACWAKDVAMCTLLVELGAERAMEDKKFKCPWDYADDMSMTPATERIGNQLKAILVRPGR